MDGDSRFVARKLSLSHYFDYCLPRIKFRGFGDSAGEIWRLSISYRLDTIDGFILRFFYAPVALGCVLAMSKMIEMSMAWHRLSTIPLSPNSVDTLLVP